MIGEDRRDNSEGVSMFMKNTTNALTLHISTCQNAKCTGASKTSQISDDCMS